MWYGQNISSKQIRRRRQGKWSVLFRYDVFRKKRFFKDSESKVTPSDKYELFCVICGEVYLPDAKKTIRKNGIILIRYFSKAKLEIKESSEIVHIVFSASHTLPILTDCTGQMFFEGFASFSLIDKLHRISCKKMVFQASKKPCFLNCCVIWTIIETPPALNLLCIGKHVIGSKKTRKGQ